MALSYKQISEEIWMVGWCLHLDLPVQMIWRVFENKNIWEGLYYNFLWYCDINKLLLSSHFGRC